MIIRIKPEEFGAIRPLFADFEFYDLGVTSVFEHNFPGRLYVDSKKYPQSSFLYLGQKTFYLVGDPDNQAFNESLKKELYSNIIPKHINVSKDPNFVLIPEANWHKNLNDIFHVLKDSKRVYYEFTQDHGSNPEGKMPNDYKLIEFTEKALQIDGIKENEWIQSWILNIYKTHENFIARAFGFCIIYKKKTVVCVGLCNYINNASTRCEIGVGTLESHQKKGLAKYLISRMITHCLNQNIRKIGWHTGSDNIASQKTTLAGGFQFKREYPIYLIPKSQY